MSSRFRNVENGLYCPGRVCHLLKLRRSEWDRDITLFFL